MGAPRSLGTAAPGTIQGTKFYDQNGDGTHQGVQVTTLHRSVPGANVTRTVPAVTGACLMIARSLYERFDGLRGIYVQGDYEDTDLCLRLLEAGFENWYLAECELYHLEGQSYDLAARLRNGRYNRWLHTHLWNDAITDVMA